MNAGNVLFLLLIVGSVFGMFFMHRGGHGHGGMGGCGGHSHGPGRDNELVREPRDGEEKKPLLGPPGTQSGSSLPAPGGRREHRHGC